MYIKTRKTSRGNIFDSWKKSPVDSTNTEEAFLKETPNERPNKKIKSNPKTDVLPLAARARPDSLDAFIGQKELVGENGLLRNLILHDKIPSMILWGPSGTGKTTLARIISNMTQSIFKEFSGITHASADLKKAFEEARNERKLFPGRRTIIFLDEIHRFNKAQQDLFLPYVESGEIILIGATTENPSFKINSSLLSRCKIFTLNKLSPDDVFNILRRVTFGGQAENESSGFRTGTQLVAEQRLLNTTNDEALKFLAVMSDGDARIALNALEIAINTSSQQTVTKEDIKRVFQKSHLQYDRDGEEHYNIISALHKSIRGSDANASLYWLGRMLTAGEDPLYIARRLIVVASEDVGLADNNALPLAIATYQACQFIGIPECEINLAHCVTYLAEAPKSVRSHKAYKLVKQTIKEEYAYPVPLHIRNAPTKLMRDLGYGHDYKYNPDYEGPVHQEYLPPELERKVFLDVYKPTKRDEEIAQLTSD